MICMRADSYKFGQPKQLRPGTKYMFSYLSPRGGYSDKVLWYGALSYYCQKYLMDKVTVENVEYMAKKTAQHGTSFNYEGWMRIATELDGKLPVIIRAIPEGTIVPNHTPLLTIMNTKEGFEWLPDSLETLLSKCWYPTTVATTSWLAKNVIKEYMMKTAGHTEGIHFKLHDFGYRGVGSEETAEIGGSAHLINFLGSDTYIANEFIEKHYGADKMWCYSIDASQHSTTTMWGGPEFEAEAFEHQKNINKGKAIFASVIDSYDSLKAIEKWGKHKDELLNNGTTLVLRPDSGDPIDMSLVCIEKASEVFGFTYNSKSYKLLKGVRVIYGDGISSPDVIANILENLARNRWSAENIAFGMGGGLLQKCDRDTLKFAIKCSAAIDRNGKVVEVYKDPISDPGKKSRKGFLDVVRNVKGELEVVEGLKSGEGVIGSAMITYFKDGELLIKESFDKIRERAGF